MHTLCIRCMYNYVCSKKYASKCTQSLEQHQVSRWAACPYKGQAERESFHRCVLLTLENFIASADPKIACQHLPCNFRMENQETSFIRHVSTGILYDVSACDQSLYSCSHFTVTLRMQSLYSMYMCIAQDAANQCWVLKSDVAEKVMRSAAEVWHRMTNVRDKEVRMNPDGEQNGYHLDPF